MDRDVTNGWTSTDSVLDTLDSRFAKADAMLQIVEDKLDHEFEETYASNVNPSKLLVRTRKIHEELPLLREEGEKLLAAKQDLIDAARNNLITNRALLCQLQARAGLPVSDANDPVYTSFVQTLEEWDRQLEVPSVMDTGNDSRPDLNLELFRSKKTFQG